MSLVEELLYRLIRPVRILYVEDDESLARIFMLSANKKYECEWTWEQYGIPALAALDKKEYDLVILDLILPDISGVEVLQYLKLKSPDTPVVVVTGAVGSRQAEEAMQCGIVCMLSKPVEISIGQIFRTFGIKVREKSDTAYFEKRKLESGDTVSESHGISHEAVLA